MIQNLSVWNILSILLFKGFLLFRFLLFDTQNTHKFTCLESLNNMVRYVKLLILKHINFK